MITDPIARRAARRLIGGYAFLALLGVAAVFLFSLGVTASVNVFQGPIEVSGWGEVHLAVRGLAVGTGVFMCTLTLPQHIAHGRTRREFAVHLPVGILVLALVLGAASTAGFALELPIYRLMGWPQEFSNSGGLYTAADQYPLIALENWLVLPTWLAAGALIGAGLTRSAILGVALMPVGGILIWAVHGALRSSDLAVPMVLTCLGVFLLTMVLTWAVVRDLPLRSRTH
ncbi:hypothetical protein F4561_005811 [Lipingzhangella halophila]|uniref:Uncharacterized protein n=1 Tax=Lipingzhangella halophila TaxID=1783352 RepID=A0A7W7W560_9ACTN|nr:hypothetical protein [Lipingzhangella halophila]MBB4934917.1 hypothetical protein [Lipingzhangella halophila]